MIKTVLKKLKKAKPAPENKWLCANCGKRFAEPKQELIYPCCPSCGRKTIFHIGKNVIGKKEEKQVRPQQHSAKNSRDKFGLSEKPKSETEFDT